jgi:hypothetical protein
MTHYIRVGHKQWQEVPIQAAPRTDYAKARRLARDGAGWEDLVAQAGVGRHWAKAVVLGLMPKKMEKTG